MQVACEVSVQNRLAVAATLFAALTVLVPRSASAQGPDLTVAGGYSYLRDLGAGNVLLTHVFWADR